MIFESHFKCRIKSIFEYWKTCFMHFERNIIAFQIVVVFWCKYYSTESKTIVSRRSLLRSAADNICRIITGTKFCSSKKTKMTKGVVFFYCWVQRVFLLTAGESIITMKQIYPNHISCKFILKPIQYYAREPYMNFQAIWFGYSFLQKPTEFHLNCDWSETELHNWPDPFSSR